MNEHMSGDELERLHHRIDGTNGLLAEVRDAVRDVVASMSHQQAGCSERMSTVYRDIEQLDHAVHGNSRAGLDARVATLETTVNSISLDRSKMAMGTGSISVKALTAILAAVSALIGGVLASLPAIIKAVNGG